MHTNTWSVATRQLLYDVLQAHRGINLSMASLSVRRIDRIFDEQIIMPSAPGASYILDIRGTYRSARHFILYLNYSKEC